VLRDGFVLLFSLSAHGFALLSDCALSYAEQGVYMLFIVIERFKNHAVLETFSFQARGFYERHGYHVYATLDGFPPGYQQLFLVNSTCKCNFRLGQ
jgi:hypothetical protein